MAQDLQFRIRISADGADAVSDDARKIRESLDGVKVSATGATTAAGGFGGALDAIKAVATPVNVALAAIAAVTVPAVRAFAEGEEVAQKLPAALDITGGAANRSVVEIEALATSIARMTKFSDEGVKTAAATLTRFDSFSGDTFDRAIRLSADLAEALGTDMPQAADQLGRALENATGATMLRRMGLLNDQQAEAIRLMKELGQDAEAQEALFAALESRVGGLAGRMGSEGLAGAWAQLGNEMGETLEALGKSVAEFTNLEGIIRGLTELTRDFNQGGISKIVDALSGTSFSYGAAFAQGERSTAAEDNKWTDIAQQAGRVANDLARERNKYLGEQDKLLGDLILKEQRHAQAVTTKGDVARVVTEAWNRGNTALIERYGTLENAINKVAAAVVKKGTAQAKTEKLLLGSISAEERAQNAMERSWNEAVRAVERIRKAQERWTLEQKQAEGAINSAIRAYEQHTLAIGASTDELERLELAEADFQREQNSLTMGTEAATKAWERQAAAIRERFNAIRGVDSREAAANAAREAEQQWQRTAQTIEQSLTDALLRGFESGKDFARNFRDSLVNMFKTLVLRPIIQAIVSPVAAGMAGLFPQSASASLLGGAAGGGGGFDLASLFGGGSSLLGYGGVSGLFSGAGGIFGAGAIGNSFALSGAGQALGLSAVGLDMAGGVALTGLGTTLGAALPVLGIALAAYLMFKKERGGPKTGGSAGNIPGMERFFTPNQADAQLGELVGATGSSYSQILRNLGGSGSAQFGFGFDSDPQGTAQDRISARAVVNGLDVYSIKDVETGRDNAATQAAMELAAQRALLAALQASEMPEQIARVFDSLPAESATKAQIETLLQFGQAMKVALDASKPGVGDDATKAWEAATQSATQRLRTMGQELSKLAKEQDGTVESMTALGVATTAYRQAVVQTLVAIRQIGQAISEMLATTREQIEFAGLDDQTAYDLARSRGNSLLEQLATTDDPAVVQSLSEQINGYLLQAFNLLSPEEQLARKPEFLAGLATLDQAVTAALTRIGTGIEGDTTDPFADVNAALATASVDFGTAAETQVSAANTMDSAATRIEAAVARFEVAVQTPLTVIGSEVGHA